MRSADLASYAAVTSCGRGLEEFQHRICDGLRRILRQRMTGPRHHAALIRPPEMPCVTFR